MPVKNCRAFDVPCCKGNSAVSDADELPRLHRALLRRDPKAPDRFADACLPRLRSLLKARHAFLPPDLAEDAATDAVLFLLETPERYQPERGSLLNFLLLIATSKLRDRWRKAKREGVDFVGGIENVELRLVETNYYREGVEQSDRRDPDALPPEMEAELRALLPDPIDRKIADLIMETGRGDVAEYAAVLGIAHLPEGERAAIVKRNRDRVMKKLQRNRAKFQRET